MSYELLRLIWWALIGVLLIGFAVMDGFDLGASALLPWVAREEKERRIVINAIGPIWEGNQVWFILGGGAIFAAWPYIYAISFSSFYIAMFLVLVTFIMRPVSFKYRSKVPDARWRAAWDWILASCGFATALLLGVAVGNVIQGVPFHFDSDLRSFYTGQFYQLLNPFALLCGLLSVSLLLMHGALYLVRKTEDEIAARAQKAAQWLALAVIVLFALGGVWVAIGIDGYALLAPMDPNGPSNPLHKQVIKGVSWLHNYAQYPWMMLAPMLGFLGAIGVRYALNKQQERLAFVASGCSIAGVIMTVGVSMFPFFLPSSSDPAQSLMVWDASSSKMTLEIMLTATLIFLPIILAYTVWVYRVMRGKVTDKTIHKELNSY